MHPSRLARALPALALLAAACAGEAPLRIKGSDTELNLMARVAEALHRVDPRQVLSVSGGGSGLGIAALLNGNAEVATSSRAMNAGERRLFAAAGVDVEPFVFAQDAVAFVVSDRQPVESLSTARLATLLSGAVADWREVGGRPGPITIYGRQTNSGTHEYLREVLHIRFAPSARQLNGNAQILEAVRADPSAIGYVGAGYLGGGNRTGLRVLRIQRPGGAAVSPLDADAVGAGAYAFRRPLYQYYRRGDTARVAPLLAFLQSPTGRVLILASGYFPVDRGGGR
jgi:phosphate transport system substrate-binding protein